MTRQSKMAGDASEAGADPLQELPTVRNSLYHPAENQKPPTTPSEIPPLSTSKFPMWDKKNPEQ